MVTHVAVSKIQAALSEVRASRGQEAGGEVAVIRPPTPQAAPWSRTDPIPQVDAQALEHAVNDIARNVRNMQRSLQFSVDESSGRTIITVIDKETNEVIRQIPPEEILAIAQHIEDASGLFLNDEA